MWQDYELLEEIGSGASGIVYRAKHCGLDRVVALKVLRYTDGPPAEAERFRREAELAAKFEHPNIVPVYELGEHDGQWFYSMKLVEGVDLTKAAERLRQDPCELARVLAVVARTLHHAHEKGVLHRDLKSANVMLDGAGQPHIVDFGLARSAQSATSLTATGIIVGTPGYLSPEQSLGRKDLTPAADIWAFGVILYELLTGRLPFQESTPYAILLAVQTKNPIRPLKINSAVPRDLETICLRCLRKAPADRYPNAAAVADDLDRFCKGERISRLRSTWNRRTLVSWVAMGLALIGMVIGGNLVREGLEGLANRAEEAPSNSDADLARLRIYFEAGDFEAFGKVLNRQPRWWRETFVPAKWLSRYEQVRPALLFSIRPSSFDMPVEEAINVPLEDTLVGWPDSKLRWDKTGRYIVLIERVLEKTNTMDGEFRYFIKKVIDGRTGRPSAATVTEVEETEWSRWGGGPERAKKMSVMFWGDVDYWMRGRAPHDDLPVVLPNPGAEPQMLLTHAEPVGFFDDRIRDPAFGRRCWNVWDEKKLPR